MIGQKIEEIIKITTEKVLNESKESYLPDDIIETDNLGEVIEKLAILHCRMWYLEDAIAENYDNDSKVAEYKKKIDICFKSKRPKYVEAINRMIENSIRTNKALIEDSVKLYKGYDKK